MTECLRQTNASKLEFAKDGPGCVEEVETGHPVSSYKGT